MTTENRLIKVVEVWTPNAANDRLELRSAAYGSGEEFRQASESLSFARGEALPGLVWESLSPLVLPDLYTEQFQRAEAARRAGLTSGLAIPVVDGDELRAVVLLLCDQSRGAQGAFEIWRRDRREELALGGEYYANLQRFSSISQFIKFPRGAGLPGEVWDTGLPRIIDGLMPESGFTRASGTGAEGLSVAVGLPITRSFRLLDSVLLMLSAEATPLANGFEIWAAKKDEDTFVLHQAAYGLPRIASSRDELRRREVVEQVRCQRCPIVVNGGSSTPSEATNHWLLAMPIFAGTELRAVFTIVN